MNVQPRIQTYSCPCCGNFIGEAAPLEYVAQSITATQQVFIFRLLSKVPGKPVSPEAIERQLWSGVRNGGPEDPRRAIYVLICKLDKHLSRYGWTIASTGRGEAGGYRLIPTEAGR